VGVVGSGCGWEWIWVWVLVSVCGFVCGFVCTFICTYMYLVDSVIVYTHKLHTHIHTLHTHACARNTHTHTVLSALSKLYGNTAFQETYYSYFPQSYEVS
jgi:hypothetical protein